MDEMNNFQAIDGSLEVSSKDANKLLKANGYKVSNKNVDALVSLKDINKIYPNGVQAVYDFNIDINEHDFIVLVGPSGCGKSTTLRMVAGLEDITSGYLYIDKVLSNYTSSKDRDISMVFQNYALYPQMTVYDNIAFPLRAKKYNRPMESVVLKSWNQALDVINNRLLEFVIAKKEAKNKDLNFGTIIEYVATKLQICDGASRILCKYKIDKIEDLDVVNKNGVSLLNQIKEEFNKQTNDEKVKLKNKGYSYDEKFNLIIDGKIQYHKVKLSEEEIRSRVFEAAEILDLGPYLDRRPKELSGGQMQRVALGRAIVRNAKLFLMDEPLSNLDAKLRVQMRSEIVRIHETIGATTIYVTHDQTEAMTMATKIVVMSKGWVQQIGTPQEIYYNPKNIFVATFIGSPAMNIFNAEYANGTLKFNNGYSIKLSKDLINRHDQYYKAQIEDLERMINTSDFKKMHALKLIDSVVFKLDDQLNLNQLEKRISEVKALSSNSKVVEILDKYDHEKINSLIPQIVLINNNNAKKKLLEIKEVINQIDDEHGEIIRGLVNEKLETLNSDQIDSSLYEEYLNDMKKVNEIILDDIDSNKMLISKANSLIMENQLNKEDKPWLLELRRPLLTFEKIPSKDIGKLHNAQVFSRNEIKVDNTIYYQKPKNKKKQTKVQVNLNSVDVEFVNNLYEVASSLLEKCKDALKGKHPIRVGIRPEDIHLNNEFDGNKTEKFNITSNIVELLGSELLIHSTWADSNMVAKISTGTLVKPHTNVELTFNKDKILIFDDNCGDTI